ncbi:hypothetical protein [Hydrogenophaga sp.]|uniref:hypothetical protein n=1 Tax=Hydrogenophaga sp. TaxID=1904254 RepID=UPI00271A6769|nr:hypothetical protein [Hydrogenophaga sp.]MDO9506006.1 hypothetical protein [Hydrogenophaga sp.]
MSAKIQTEQYFAALERLKARRAVISNDAVAMEAGKGRGSIKSSRPAHAALVAAIEEAAKAQRAFAVTADPVPGLRAEVDELTRRLDQSLEREVALLHELYDLRSRTKALGEENLRLKMGRLVPVK